MATAYQKLLRGAVSGALFYCVLSVAVLGAVAWVVNVYRTASLVRACQHRDRDMLAHCVSRVGASRRASAGGPRPVG